MSECSIFALAAHKDLHLFQIDVVTAFLNGDLLEDVYIDYDPRPEVGDATKVVFNLFTALHNLKKAPR